MIKRKCYQQTHTMRYAEGNSSGQKEITPKEIWPFTVKIKNGKYLGNYKKLFLFLISLKYI